MNIYDIFPQLSENILFSDVDKNKVCEYLSDQNITLKLYKSNEIIISPENTEIPVGIVISGLIEITSATESHKVLLKTASKGSMFGVANLYAENSRFPSKISARTDSEILLISPYAFKNLLENDSRLMRNFLNFLSKKVLYLNKKISSYTAGNTECKLAYFLCENNVEGVVRVDMSLSDIAVMLDMGRASLYRSFDKFEEEKLIKRDGRNIYIINKEKLKKIYN